MKTCTCTIYKLHTPAHSTRQGRQSKWHDFELTYVWAGGLQSRQRLCLWVTSSDWPNLKALHRNERRRPTTFESNSCSNTQHRTNNACPNHELRATRASIRQRLFVQLLRMPELFSLPLSNRRTLFCWYCSDDVLEPEIEPELEPEPVCSTDWLK